MTTNEITEQFEQFPANQYESESIDETLLVAMTNEHRNFCITVENFLINFIKSSKQKELLPDLDKFKRKIVHKLAERYGVKREFVNLKPNDLGDITLTRSEESSIPALTLTEIMRRRDLEREKSTVDQSKTIKIFKRNQGNYPNDQNFSQNQKKKETFQNSQKEEEFEIQQKNEKYEEAKKRILIGKTANPPIESLAEKNKFNKTESRQNNNNSTNYDPDYNRNLNRPAPQPIYQQPPMIPIIPPVANFNNNYNFNPGNNPNFMKYAPPPGYQNFPPNHNLLNDLHYQNQNPNLLYSQMNYNNNYGMYQTNGQQIGQNPMNLVQNSLNMGQNSMNMGQNLMNMGQNSMNMAQNSMNMGQNSNNNQMNMGLFQQQPMQQPIYNNNNFQGNMNKPNNENFVGSMFVQENSRNYNGPSGYNNNNNQTVGAAEVKKKPNKFNLEKIFNEENFPSLEKSKDNKH